MMHYHGTPITPRRVLLELAGKNFCVSYAHSLDVVAVHQIGQSVMIDNGSFSFHTRQKPTDWPAFYAWLEPWLDYKTTWFVIPDVIDGSAKENDDLLLSNPFGAKQSAPVWHLHEPTDRILRLVDSGYDKICFGSSGSYWMVGSDMWHARVSEAFNLLSQRGPIPWVHMLRGMSLSGSHYPFSSVDSTDVARNHNRKNNAKAMAERWDAIQCPANWSRQLQQENLL